MIKTITKYSLEYDDKKVSEVMPGDKVLFGRYMQYGNKTEPVLWRVLDKWRGMIFLVSEFGLDCRKFNDTEEHVCWPESTLRKWLNDEFLNNAFNADEQKMICKKTISSKYPKNDCFDDDNKDKVFILTIDEALKYLNREDRQCIPTGFALKQGVFKNENFGSCYWWLICSYYNRQYPGGADYTGFAVDLQHCGNWNHVAVRPCIWVKDF